MINQSFAAAKPPIIDFKFKDNLNKTAINSGNIGTVYLNNRPIDVTYNDVSEMIDTLTIVRDTVYKKIKLGMIS